MSGSTATQNANRERLLAGIPEGWHEPLRDATEHEAFGRLADSLVALWAAGNETYPAESEIFRALKLTPLDTVRAVVLGQDPYPTQGRATGLAFSVPPGRTHPPSLQKILTARNLDLGLPRPISGSLESWARNGVLLLNTALTVGGGATSKEHLARWQPFTDAVMKGVGAREWPIAFLLWGRPAQECFERNAIPGRHVPVRSLHPAAWSQAVEPRFIDSKPFRRANDGLRAKHQPAISWSLPEDT